MVPTQQTETYNTLEEIQLRRDQLSAAINQDSEKIANLWSDMFSKNKDATKGEHIATIVTNAITAIDAFLMVRKLMKNYSNVLSFLNLGTKKKKRHSS